MSLKNRRFSNPSLAVLIAAVGLFACADPVESALPPDLRSPGERIQVQTQTAPPPTHLTSVKANPPTTQTKPATAKPAQMMPKAATPAPKTPKPAKVALSGPQPHFPVRRCMNVANALEAPNEGEWGYTVRVDELRAIALAGFDTIRLPVRWDTHMRAKPPYTVEALFMARIKRVVSQAQREGLGVILDVHHYEDLIANPKRHETQFLALWEQIATEFQNAPKTVYFEVLNEPTNAMSMRQLNSLYTKVLPIIRKTNPTRTVILGGNSWNAVDTMDAIAWPNDTNLVATFHDYGPHEFTHQGAPWVNNDWPVGRKWGRKSDLAELQDTYDIAARFQVKRNVPILVGEFGVIDTVPQDERNAWLKQRRQYIEAAGYSWCAWDLAGAFKTYNKDLRSWQSGVLDALISD